MSTIATEGKRANTEVFLNRRSEAAASFCEAAFDNDSKPSKVPVTKSFKQLLKRFKSIARVSQNNGYSSDMNSSLCNAQAQNIFETDSQQSSTLCTLPTSKKHGDNTESTAEHNRTATFDYKNKRHTLHISASTILDDESLEVAKWNLGATTARRSNSLYNNTAFYSSLTCSVIEEQQHHDLVLCNQATLIPISTAASSISSSYISSSESVNQICSENMQLKSDCTTSHGDRHSDEVHLFDLQTKLWKEDPVICSKEEIAQFLGSYEAASRERLLDLYMRNFDFKDQKLDIAFRALCKKLYLKAESQELDRIVEAFAKRYHDCNPTAIFRHVDIIYTISYSLLLLNTDLHAATDHSSKMSRTEYIENTMKTIRRLMYTYNGQQQTCKQQFSYRRRCLSSSSISSKHSLGSGLSLPRMNRNDASRSSSGILSLEKVPTNLSSQTYTTGCTDISSNNTRISAIVSGFMQKVDALSSNISWKSHPSEDSCSIDSSYEFKSQQLWVANIENLLKDMYAAVKSRQFDQPGFRHSSTMKENSTASVGLCRSRTLPKSLASVTDSEGQMITIECSNVIDEHTVKQKRRQSVIQLLSRSTKNKATAGKYVNDTKAAKTSLFKPTTITSTTSTTSAPNFLTDNDEKGEVVKEGLFMRKHVMETFNKKSRQRQWQLCYLTLTRTELILHKPRIHYSERPYDTKRVAGQQGRRKSSSAISWRPSHSSAIGGSLFQQYYEQQQQIGICWTPDTKHAPESKIAINHTYTTIIPPPGWNGQRPHVFRLETCEGGVWLFESPDEQVTRSWTDACNAAAARISKGLLHGAVSNINYGWKAQNQNNSVSIWYPPAACMLHSRLELEDQQQQIVTQIEALQRELEEHMESKVFVDSKLSMGGSQALKNWNNKHDYILYELAKFRCYRYALDKSV